MDARDIPPARPVADVQLKAGVEPVWVSPYPTPVNNQAAEKQVLADLLRLGKIRELGPGHSNAPFFLKMERKSDGSTKVLFFYSFILNGSLSCSKTVLFYKQCRRSSFDLPHLVRVRSKRVLSCKLCARATHADCKGAFAR